MLLEQYFELESGWNLFGEFLEWLMLDGDPPLTKRVWVLLTTGMNPALEERRVKVGELFTEREGPGEWEATMKKWVGEEWGKMDPLLQIVKEVDEAWPL